VWTDSAVATPAAPISYRYANLTTTAPTDINCINNWTPACRVIINYEANIHPLWSAARDIIDPNDNVTVIGSNTCSQGGCHAPVNAMNQTAVPAGQLDLTDGASPDEADQFNSYRELLFADNRQILNGGALQDEQIQIGIDAMGNPILAPVSIGASMSAAGARASRFFSCFDVGGTGCPGQSHAGFLSPDELRLLSEWLDIGAQYYNNPFAVPVM